MSFAGQRLVEEIEARERLEREVAETRERVRAALDNLVAMYQQRSVDVAGAGLDEEGIAGAGEAAARVARSMVLKALCPEGHAQGGV